MESPFVLPGFLYFKRYSDILLIYCSTLGYCLIHWKRYGGYTHSYINPGKLEVIIKTLNKYHTKT